MTTFARRDGKDRDKPDTGKKSGRNRAVLQRGPEDAEAAQTDMDASLNQSSKVQSQVELGKSLNRNSQAVAQGKLAEALSSRGEIAKPTKPTQRQISLEDEEMLQGKFEPVQKEEGFEDEDTVMTKAASIQRQDGLDEQDLLQGKFEPVQKQEGFEDEDPVMAKAAVQKQDGLDEEDLLQGKFEPVQKQEGFEDEDPVMAKAALQKQDGLDEEDLLQGKFEPVQKEEGFEDEDTVMTKAAPVQKQDGLDEEDLLQGKFEPVQKEEGFEDEDPVMAKAAVQKQDGLDEEDLLQGKFEPVQKEEGFEDEEPIMTKTGPVQRQEAIDEDDLLQGKTLQARTQTVQRSGNETGLPDQLKAGVETLSGLAMDDVNVHYNSAKPAQLNALAYTQGSDIHVGPGQEKHLAHEAWHVAQQKEGRVEPTTQAKGVAINDDEALEREADRMGEKAMQLKGEPQSQQPPETTTLGAAMQLILPVRASLAGSIQRKARNRVIQRVIYPDMNALFAAAAPGVAPVIANLSPTLQALIADAENQLPHTDVVAVPGLGRVAEAAPNPAPPPVYLLNYDPATANQRFLLSSLVHELIHLSSAENYDRGGPVPAGLLGGWAANLNLPAAETEASFWAQVGTLSANLNDLYDIVTNDNTLAAPVRAHIRNERIPYGDTLVWFEYDTVLSDILTYLELNNAPANSPTLSFVRRLVNEARDRRLNRPMWGVREARRVESGAAWYKFWKW